MKLLSLNGRDHWASRHRRSQALKQAAWALAKQAKIPPLGRVAVIVEYRPPDRRHRDAENICITSAKAAIDGIVQAGVLPDDECPRYVSRIACTIGEPYPKGMLVLYLIEVGAEAETGGAA
jgi:crossover junction endodeoxyribonuclease RusA